MKSTDIYKEAYRLLDKLTPLPIDCGQLCGGICCSDGGREDAGMYLFFGEEKMYDKKPDWIRIEESEFLYGDDDRKALIAMCPGRCNRSMRPLSCRIFPLTPYKKEAGPLSIIMDPRAKAMCPLAKALDISDLDQKFVHTVKLIFNVLIKNKKIEQFICELSYLFDDTEKFYS